MSSSSFTDKINQLDIEVPGEQIVDLVYDHLADRIADHETFLEGLVMGMRAAKEHPELNPISALAQSKEWQAESRGEFDMPDFCLGALYGVLETRSWWKAVTRE